MQCAMPATATWLSLQKVEWLLHALKLHMYELVFTMCASYIDM